MRKPEDKRFNEVAKEDCDIFKLRWALSDATLVLMTCAMMMLLEEFLFRFSGSHHLRRLHSPFRLCRREL
ncbi:hypothetical protein NT239_00225 [Chitinibacter sp. SCUT-21]|uniref:hypothetical protein n=1 Tax=Chitinibacter sp. SCUT-21 TaxID=2970891 RepID=UPI0035A73B6E